ncbi:MAG: MFS transporter [Lachnospiraceae bacterium]|nr:MFS transporter [Lachnospiraceae bacterium]
MRFQYKHTIYASFIGYIVQAIVNNFVPLLFLTFQSEYGISLDKIALLTGMNFGVQLAVDLISAKFADRIGYRRCIIAAHIFSAAGLIGLTVLPDFLPDPYLGICLAVGTYAIGGGLIEVLISPIVEACPGKKKEKAMSLLHSFYCWGHVGVVLLSSLFFLIFGIRNWRYMAIIWAVIPLLNISLFAKVPIASLIKEGETGYSIGELFTKRAFWIFMLLMVCAGSCEQAVSQWASAYAESGLHVSKAIGDLAGPLLFAVTMGSARLFYGKFGEKIELQKFMVLSGILCLCSYLMIGFAPIPLLGFLGCALCGLSVGILWPGTFSLAAKGIPRGGTAMFAFFALAGDLGCGSGPTYVGILADAFGGKLNMGILAAVIFPILLLIGLVLNAKMVSEMPS